MKKLIFFAFAAMVGLELAAQEVAEGAAANRPQSVDRPQMSAAWPVPCAIWEVPYSPDVAGVRVTVPYSTRQESVTGVDIGLWGRSLYFEGLQANVLRNDVKDSCAGAQVGLYNSIGRGDMIGVQVGLWNESLSLVGAQGGLVNLAGDVKGVQIGLINRCETMYGYQLGLINIIRDAELQFCPILNVGF